MAPIVPFQLSLQLTLAAGVQIQCVRSHLTAAIDVGTPGELDHSSGALRGARDAQANHHGHS